MQARLIAMLSEQLLYTNAEVSCLVVDGVLRDTTVTATVEECQVFLTHPTLWKIKYKL